MPDIREIIKALLPEDRTLWQQCRNNMRSVYLNAHNSTVGMPAWNHDDDAFLDLIDIKLATLFDRSGRLIATKEIIGDSKTIEDDLEKADDAMKEKPSAQKSEATKLMEKEMSFAVKSLQQHQNEKPSSMIVGSGWDGA